MQAIEIKRLSEEAIRDRRIRDWPIWEKEVSRFDWEYEGDEECLILEGLVEVETDQGTFTIRPGDFVTFRRGLRCVWDVRSPVRKHYNFP